MVGGVSGRSYRFVAVTCHWTNALHQLTNMQSNFSAVLI